MTKWLEKLPNISQEVREELAKLGDDLEVAAEVISRKLASKREVLLARSRYYRLPSVFLSGYLPTTEAVELLTEEQARKLKVMPLFVLGKELYVAMPDPYDLRCEDFLRKLTEYRIKPVLADGDDISKAITRKYLAARQGGKSEFGDSRKTVRVAKPKRPTQEELNEDQSPVVKEVWRILRQGIRLGASDIHLEPEKDFVTLRYRIDGVLHTFAGPEKTQYSAIVSRIKVISDLDIAEKRLPQDGRISTELESREYDLRVSLLPNVHGEGVCIRILDSSAAGRPLEKMGFEPDLLQRYEQVIRKPHGIVLVTGPTGSGKSTTLYSTLSRINTPERKLITVEDPVEYKLAGMQQVPIKPDIGYTFGVGLKAILRHDPDIIMLGEIRDLESAQIAFRAALTGHLLFSTLHTNSAAQAVLRLVDMGLPKYQVVAGLNGVLAQRLVRVLCPHCKQQSHLTPEQIKEFDLPSDSSKQKIYEPSGCGKCDNLGFKGRTGVHEFIRITPEMKRLKEDEISTATLEDLARQDGFQSLRESALRKLFQGETSLSEVIAVTDDY